MTLKWNVPMVVEFPEEDLTDIIKYIKRNGYEEETVITYIDDIVLGFEDRIYYNWGQEQTMEVLNKIKQRLGGVQLSIFDEEVSEN